MIWEEYHKALAPLEDERRLRRPVVPTECDHGGHLYYLLLNSTTERDTFIKEMARKGINCVTHYMPLHSSPAGRRYGRVSNSEMTVTNSVSETLVRLPIWIGIEEHQPRIIDAIYEIFQK
jgi:dTDP-4-amino-4,6-dideoxygalactose transaminase